MRTQIAVVLLAGAAASSVWAQSQGLLRSALERAAATSLHNWRFTRIRTVDGAPHRERCVGVSYREAECRLVFVDGKPPSAEQRAHYSKSVAQPVVVDLPNVNPNDYVEASSATGKGTSAGMATYTFTRPRAGSMLVDKEEGFVVQINIGNVELHFVEVDDAVMLDRLIDPAAHKQIEFLEFRPPY